VNSPSSSFSAACLGLLLLEGLLGLLDQGEHVAHAEDAAGHAVGVELLELGELLARRREGDRPADDLLHRQRGTAAGVAVELRHDDAVDRQRGVERLGHAHRVLAGHRVDDEERVVGLDLLGDLADLLHHLGVDREAAGGVDDEHVLAEAAGLGEAAAAVATGSPGSLNTGTSIWRPSVRSCSTAAGRWRSAPTSSGWRPWLLNQRASLAELVVLPEPCRPAISTTVGGRLGVGDLQRLAAEHRGELAVDDLDDLLAGVERRAERHADRLLADADPHRCGRRRR
jgi:hypothetical protein